MSLGIASSQCAELNGLGAFQDPFTVQLEDQPSVASDHSNSYYNFLKTTDDFEHNSVTNAIAPETLSSNQLLCFYFSGVQGHFFR